MQSRRQPAPVSCVSESAAPSLKLEDVQVSNFPHHHVHQCIPALQPKATHSLQDMYTQLARSTQLISEREQKKTRQLSVTREELVEKMTLLAKAKGLCRKLLHRSKRHRTQLESELVQARNQMSQEEEEGGSTKLQDTIEELHQARKDAEYYKQKWHQSQVMLNHLSEVFIYCRILHGSD